jgi:hypothetical protein
MNILSLIYLHGRNNETVIPNKNIVGGPIGPTTIATTTILFSPLY